jgi:hypothetical protein
MVSLVPETLPDLTRKHILMSSRIFEPIVSKQEAERDFLVYSKMQEQISHSVGRRVVMSEQ